MTANPKPRYRLFLMTDRIGKFSAWTKRGIYAEESEALHAGRVALQTGWCRAKILDIDTNKSVILKHELHEGSV